MLVSASVFSNFFFRALGKARTLGNPGGAEALQACSQKDLGHLDEI